MNIVFCNFDFENWRFDLVCKLADEFSRRGHSTFYYGYKRELCDVFSKVDTKMVLVQFAKYQKTMSLAEHQKFTEQEIEEIISYNKKLNVIMKRPVKANAELGKKVNIFLEKLRSYHDAYRPDIYIVWGGNRYHEKAIISFAKKNNARAYCFEFGYFRPFTLTVEEKGLNYNNSVPRNPDFFRNRYLDEKADLSSILKPSKAVRVPNEKLSRVLGSPPERVMNRGKLAKRLQKGQLLDLNRKYVFVPFQVESDTQIVEHSPHIKTMRNLVALTAEAVIDYNLKYNDDLKIVFKPHPADVDLNIDYIEDLIQCYPHAEIAYADTTPDLIRKAALVMTINSTVGIEALIEKKSVITLGNAFYAIEGLAINCMDYDELPNVIKAAMDKEVDEPFVFKYLKYLREEYFHEIYYEGADPGSIRSLVDRIVTPQTV